MKKTYLYAVAVVVAAVLVVVLLLAVFLPAATPQGQENTIQKNTTILPTVQPTPRNDTTDLDATTNR